MQISDEYVDLLISLFENVRDNQFSIGDMLVELIDLHPNQRQEVIFYLAGKVAVSASSLYDYENTSRRWTKNKRKEYPKLDWTIYRNSDPERDRELLDKCIDEHWNATKFKEAMYPVLAQPGTLIKRVLGLLDKIISSDRVSVSMSDSLISLRGQINDLYDSLDDEL